jgi:hypothetical protein
MVYKKRLWILIMLLAKIIYLKSRVSHHPKYKDYLALISPFKEIFFSL